MLDNSKNRERKYHLIGWGLYLVCACFFIAASIRSGNTLYLIASIIFLIGCVVFIIPLTKKTDNLDDDIKG